MVATPVRAILDTVAGPNLIREEVLPEDWERYRVAERPTYHVVGAGCHRLRQKGVVTLCVEVGRLRTKARFLVVPNLAAECILWCEFIDRHVRTILPLEKRVTLADESAVSILQDSGPLRPRTPPKDPKTAVPSTKVQVSQKTTLPPHSENLVWV